MVIVYLFLYLCRSILLLNILLYNFGSRRKYVFEEKKEKSDSGA